jgi:hypothetical protein
MATVVENNKPDGFQKTNPSGLQRDAEETSQVEENDIIARLLAQPLKVPDFTPLTREEAHARSSKALVPTTALADSVEFDEALMYVWLTDGRVVGVPIIWFPLLHQATPAQRTQYEIGGGGVSLHWPELDEDICVANLLAGADWRST